MDSANLGNNIVVLPDSQELDIASLAAVFANVTNSYKFYWLLAILESLTLSPSAIISIDSLLARMITQVWYPIHYFRLSLGKQDRLAQTAHLLRSQVKGLDASAQPADIYRAILLKCSSKSPLSRQIRSLGDYVPQRFLRPFFHGKLRGVQDSKIDALIERLAGDSSISGASPSPYRFISCPERSIQIHDDWLEYLLRHLHILMGFCLWHLTNHIQKNNPNVPGIPNKLFRPEERDLRLARTFWRLAIKELKCPRCIYSDILIQPENFSLDHFLPWSFVAHDLLWNIIPTSKAINSQKGDQLPDMEHYFDSFASLQYEAVQALIIPTHARLLEDHASLVRAASLTELQNISFVDFRQNLRNTMMPQVQIARNLGFASDWSYRSQ